MKIQIRRVPAGKMKAKPEDALNLAFGTVFTDHMLTMHYRSGSWQKPRIEPYGPLNLDPAAMVLHYGQGIFEGMKAYRTGDKIFLFRARDNFDRLNASADRMVMPTIDADLLLESLKELLLLEREWIPQERGAALYIRPTMIATEPRLGVRQASEYLYFVILCPVGPYFREGFNPVGVFVSDKYVRSVKGGVGHAKTLVNYATGMRGLKEAMDSGHPQVLWLDAIERKYIEETATMNVFVRFKDEIATPPLGGTILPGITRASVIQLGRDWGYEIGERDIAIDEVIEGIKSGEVCEVFGSGTAALIAPIGHLTYMGVRYVVAGGKAGDLSLRLFNYLTDLQRGAIEDKHGWIESITW
jgi:branched-chain amino acid aminotransferase